MRANEWGLAAWQELYEVEEPEMVFPLMPGRIKDGAFRVSPAVRCVMINFGLTSKLNEELDTYVNLGEEVTLEKRQLARAAEVIDRFIAVYAFWTTECSMMGRTHQVNRKAVRKELSDLAAFLRESSDAGKPVVIAL